MAEILITILSIILVILLFLSILLPKKIHYILSGVTLLVLGVLPVLHDHGIIGVDINQFPIANFVIYFLVVNAGKELFKEGFEEQSKLKYPTMFLGVFLIIFTTIPTLNKLGVTEFVMPAYPKIIDSVLYIVCGVFLIVGAFTLLRD